MYTRQNNYTVVLSLIIQGNTSLNYIGTASALNKGGDIYINVTESYRVPPNRELRIIRVGYKSPPAVRSESAIETVVLRILSY